MTNTSEFNIHLNDTICEELYQFNQVEQGLIIDGLGRTMSYKLAKLAMLKGFDAKAQRIYYNPAKQMIDHKIVTDIGRGRRYNWYKTLPRDGIERIHTTLLSVSAEWLRDEKEIDVVIVPSIFNNKKTYNAEIYHKCTKIINFFDFESYDLAMEHAQRYAIHTLL